MYQPVRFRRTIHPDLRAAARAASADGLRLQDIALNAGFASAQQLSNQLHGRRIPQTPRVVERFQRVAALLNYTGDLFLDCPEKQRA